MTIERDASNSRIERDVEAMRNALVSLQSAIDTKLDTIRGDFNRYAQEMPEKYVPRREINERFSNMGEDQRNAYGLLSDRVKEIEDTQKWLVRLTIGSLITGLIGVFFNLARTGALAAVAGGG